MIKSFKHKGLEELFTTGTTSGVQADHVVMLIDQLTALHTARAKEDMNIPRWRLHKLDGQHKGNWAITVNKNWRVVFEFEDGDVCVVNYEDCH